MAEASDASAARANAGGKPAEASITSAARANAGGKPAEASITSAARANAGGKPAEASPESPSFARALAFDYDGTLTSGGPPSADVLQALAEARAGGRRLILVTGRILEELRADFPGVDDHFDAIVAENGGVLSMPRRGARALHRAVGAGLADAIALRGIAVRRGQVLLAIDGEHEAAVAEEIRARGLEAQIVRNRAALMVLPPAVSKGSGLYAALGALGISYHNAIAFGDAENDHSLLDVCALGVAVDNAVPSLKSHADVVLREPDGEGIAHFLRGPVVRGDVQIVPERWAIEVGRFADGFPATIPAAQVNVLIGGETATGKSWLAGLFAERLIEADYSVCVLDPEGDHPGLGRLRGVVTLGGPDGAPPPADIRRYLEHRFGSVVVDLAALRDDDKREFYVAALDQLQAQRRANGLPHWIFLDEAQLPEQVDVARILAANRRARGFCLVTWHPDELSPEYLEEIDIVVLTSAIGLRGTLDWLPARFHPAEAARACSELRRGEALLIRPDGASAVRRFRTGSRSVEHVRHWHKYVTQRLPEHRRFHFVSPAGPTGRSAANLPEFHHEIQRADAATLRRHAAAGDFSRWIREVVRDDPLAAVTGAEELRLAGDARAAEAFRAAILDAIRGRYLEEGGAPR